jgi:hypothetical protein
MIILNNMQKLCTQCFYIGVEESNIYGDFTTESILWGTAFFFALAGAFETFLWFPATIIFFIALLYSISGYTFKACVCSKCHSDSMIPVDSDKARQIIHERGLVPPAYIVEKDERTILGMAFRTIFFILTVVLVLFMLYDHFS